MQEPTHIACHVHPTVEYVGTRQLHPGEARKPVHATLLSRLLPKALLSTLLVLPLFASLERAHGHRLSNQITINYYHGHPNCYPGNRPSPTSPSWWCAQVVLDSMWSFRVVGHLLIVRNALLTHTS